MNDKKTILVVDDEEFIRVTLKKIFDEENYNVVLTGTGREALDTINKQNIDLALLDINLPDINGIDVLKRIKQTNPELLVIVATGYASVESAIDAIKLGAYDYIKKPFKADAIKLITRLALETQSLKETVQKLKETRPRLHQLEDIIGVSPAINKLKEQLIEYAKVDTETVLITGESGSGKELVAQVLHSLSSRADNDFVEINCASIPENLLESELFGHEKGAFTDAHGKKIGLIEKAEGGTLFLDEIGEMSVNLQANLLRVIENKKIRRLGATTDIEVDVRIIAATNRNLKEAISEKIFREDLYYRLNVLRVNIPPLRERQDDIPELTKFFLHHFNMKFNKQIESCSDDARTILTHYRWPGNVRELKNTIERICIIHKEKQIEAHHLPEDLIADELHDLVEKDSLEFENSELALDQIIEKTEMQLIKKAYLMSGKNISKAARMLKIPRETFRYKFSKYNLGDGEN